MDRIGGILYISVLRTMKIEIIMNRNVLFVDDTDAIWTGYKRILPQRYKEWTFHFANSGVDALDILETVDMLLIVSDFNMPFMDGAHLLDIIAEKYPTTIRMLQSASTDVNDNLRTVRSAHRFLAKPLNQKEFSQVLDQIIYLEETLELAQTRTMITSISTIPTIPSVYLELVGMLENPDSSMREIGELVSQDIGLSAKILELVNSSFFGVTNKVSTPENAVTLLGMEIIKGVVVTLDLFSQFSPQTMREFDILYIMEHSFQTAQLSRTIAKYEGLDEEECDTLYTAALLHNIGKLLFITSYPDVYGTFTDEMITTFSPMWEVEQRLIGTTHNEVGAYLLGLWGFSNETVKIIRYYHQPSLYNSLQTTILNFTDIYVYKKTKEWGMFLSFDVTHYSGEPYATKMNKWAQLCESAMEY